MGHRALIAYERPDELYNCHYAHWGGLHLRLKHEISSAAPFGGEDGDAEWARELFDCLIEGASDAALEDLLSENDPPVTTVDPVPRVRGASFDEILTEQLDFLHHDAFYVVDTNFEATAYRSFWFGLKEDAEYIKEKGRSVRVWFDQCVATMENPSVRLIQGKFRGINVVVADLIDRTCSSLREASSR